MMADPKSRAIKYSLRRQFVDLKYDPRSEAATSFLTKFDTLVEKIKRCPDGAMSEIEIKRGLLIAIEGAFPAIHMRDVAMPGGMKLDEIRTLLVEGESREKEILRREERTETAMMTSSGQLSTKQSGSQVVCFKCGDFGHMKNECNRSAKKCYNCGKFVSDHISVNCPERSMHAWARDDSQECDAHPVSDEG